MTFIQINQEFLKSVGVKTRSKAKLKRVHCFQFLSAHSISAFTSIFSALLLLNISRPHESSMMSQSSQNKAQSPWGLIEPDFPLIGSFSCKDPPKNVIIFSLDCNSHNKWLWNISGETVVKPMSPSTMRKSTFILHSRVLLVTVQQDPNLCFSWSVSLHSGASARFSREVSGWFLLSFLGLGRGVCSGAGTMGNVKGSICFSGKHHLKLQTKLPLDVPFQLSRKKYRAMFKPQCWKHLGGNLSFFFFYILNWCIIYRNSTYTFAFDEFSKTKYTCVTSTHIKKQNVIKEIVFSLPIHGRVCEYQG